MEWIIKFNEGFGSTVYYTGGTYQYVGELYAAFSSHIAEAKVYSSQRRAINSMKALSKKVCNFSLSEIEVECKTLIELRQEER